VVKDEELEKDAPFLLCTSSFVTPTQL